MAVARGDPLFSDSSSYTWDARYFVSAIAADVHFDGSSYDTAATNSIRREKSVLARKFAPNRFRVSKKYGGVGGLINVRVIEVPVYSCRRFHRFRRRHRRAIFGRGAVERDKNI